MLKFIYTHFTMATDCETKKRLYFYNHSKKNINILITPNLEEANHEKYKPMLLLQMANATRPALIMMLEPEECLQVITVKKQNRIAKQKNR